MPNMSTGKKVAIAGGVGLLVYLVYQHFQAAGQITALAGSTTPVTAVPASTPLFGTPLGAAPPATTAPIVKASTLTTTPLTLAPGTTTTAAPDPSQLQALLTWATSTKNPTLYSQMINQLNASDLATLYNILTTQWETGSAPTPAHTAFWNGLRVTYPFLNTGGVGCNNLACN